MANTRFKGANASERLTLTTLSDSDMFQTRHLPGTVNDADKGVSKSLLQALPVAVCATAAATAAKVGTLAPESCPDLTLVNGRVIHVYFSAANTASVPTINVAGTGAIPITYPNGDYVGAWAAGTTMDLMYISITVDNTAIERWVVVSSLPVDEVALNNMHSVTSNAVAEAGSYSTTEHFTGKYWIDEKPIYEITKDFGSYTTGWRYEQWDQSADTIVSYYGRGYVNSSKLLKAFPNYDNYLSVSPSQITFTDSSQSFDKILITIFYTKTTN